MSFTSLFSMRGRVGRQNWWLTSAVSIVFFAISIFAISAIFGGKTGLGGDGLASGKEIGTAGAIAFMIVMLIYAWINFCVSAKRWHDRDKSAWWILLGSIPVIGFWVLIENGFLRGTDGENRFGKNPLQH